MILTLGRVAQFRKIEEVESSPATTSVDVMGVVESVDMASKITRRDGKEAEKRSIVIRDDSNKSIEVTFWGPYAENPGAQLEEVRFSIPLIDFVSEHCAGLEATHNTNQRGGSFLQACKWF